jgi:HPt (histidine-containing phosphotransfer) domain-containing protein
MLADLELDELKREFLGEALEKVREMQEKVDDGSPEAIERVAYLAHQLKGSGGSYGFQSISDAAAELEKAVARGKAEVLADRVANLRAVIDGHARELAPG